MKLSDGTLVATVFLVSTSLFACASDHDGDGGSNAAGASGSTGGQAGSGGDPGAGSAGSPSSGGGSPTGGTGGGSTGGAGGGQAGSAACASELPASFEAVPAPYAVPAPRCQTRFDAFASDQGVAYSLLDMTGDARADLIVSRDDCAPDVGKNRWDLYAANDAGFDPVPTGLTIPAPRCQTSFDGTQSDYGAISYGVADLVGDTHPDIIVFRDDCDNDVGATRWDVYPGSAGGFAAVPMAYTIPAPRCQTRFDGPGSFGYGDVGYALLDLTSDGRADLVVFDDACDSDVGSARWDVYPSGSDGFAPIPAAYGVPAPRCQTRFDGFASSGYGDVQFGLLDLSADGRPDLVVFHDECDPAVGGARWDVYAGESSGFAASPSAWALPAPRCQSRFDAASSGGYDNVQFTVADLSCDGLPDLIVTSDACDADIGSARWDVYVAAGSGFAPGPSSLAVPAPRCQRPFDTVQSGGYGGLTFGLLDMARDGRADLVVTGDDCDDAVGSTRWDIYRLQ